MMRHVAMVLVAVAVIGFGAYTVRRMDAADRLAVEQRQAIAELRGEMEFQAVRLAERDVRREAMRRNAETLCWPAEIARLRAAQRKSERDGSAASLFSLEPLRAVYARVWADYYNAETP